MKKSFCICVCEKKREGAAAVVAQRPDFNTKKKEHQKQRHTRSFDFHRAFKESIPTWGQCKSEHTSIPKM